MCDVCSVIPCLIDDPDPVTADLAALQVEAHARVRFCRQALEALCTDRIDIDDPKP